MTSHVVEVTLANPLLWPQSFEILVIYFRQPLSLSSNKMMTGRCILQVFLQVWLFLYMGDWYHSLVCCNCYYRLCLFRKVCEFHTCLDLKQLTLSNGNGKTQTQNTFIPKLMFPLWNSSYMEFKFHHYHDCRMS